jgi:hypothetical protein
MHEAIEAHGPTHSEVARQNRRLEALGLFDLILLFAIVWAMVLKPTSDDLETLLIPALALVAAAFFLFRAYRTTDGRPAARTTA